MRYLHIFITVLFFGKVSAQPELRFWHLNHTNGLSGTVAKSIAQDQQGFMWIGTEMGLNRYDSKNVVSFKKGSTDGASLPGNKISRIVADRGGVLWIVTDGGLCSFNTFLKKCVHYPLSEKGETIRFINDFFIDSENNHWVATDATGWGRLDLQGKKYLRENFDSQPNDTHFLNNIYAVQAIAEDKHGNLFIGSRAYSLIVRNKQEYLSGNKHKLVYPYPAHSINTIYCDSRGRVWIGSWDNALHLYNPESKTLTNIFLDHESKIDYSGNEITCISEDLKGRLWIGTNKKGLYLFDPVNGAVSKYTQNRFNRNGISDNSIRCIYRDREGRMWLGTDSGVDIFDPLLNQFDVHYLDNNFASTELINGFSKEGDKLFIATNSGLYIESAGHQKPVMKTFLNNKKPLSFTSLFKDSHGTMYAGTNKTVFVLETKKISLRTLNTFYNRTANSDFDFYDIPSSRIVHMAESHWLNHDVLWVSPYGHGLAAFDIRKKAGFVTPVFGKGVRYEHLINKIYIDSKENVFCLTARNGISENFIGSGFADSIFNLAATKQNTILTEFVPIRTDFLDEKIPGLPADVFDMIEAGENVYWITSPSGGLFKLSLKDNTLMQYPNEYPNMFGMQRDGNGNLWIISSAGIEFYNPIQNIFHHFGAVDGIPEEGLHGYIYKDNDGYFFAGGRGYYLKFKPEEIIFNLAKPVVSIVHFKIFDLVADSLLTSDKINLSYRQNHFSFEFVSLNFTNASENTYQYKLDGLDDRWISAGSRTYVSYTNLNGGNYVFHVRSSNNNNVWSESDSVQIYIKPPLWQYKWFYPALVLVLTMICFLIYRNRINSKHRIHTARLLAEIDAQEKERRRIARDLHDEFGTKMSALKIYLSTYEKFIDHQNQEAVRTKKELYSIVDDSMHDLRSMLMDLSPKTLELHGFSTALHDLANRLSNTHLFQIKCFVSPAMERFDSKFELTIFRIVQELINNSIKHAECREISIQLFHRDSKIVLSYEDDGKGFEQEKVRIAGYGLKNIETRVSLLEGKVRWETSPGNGINVMIEIPYEIQELKPDVIS